MKQFSWCRKIQMLWMLACCCYAWITPWLKDCYFLYWGIHVAHGSAVGLPLAVSPSLCPDHVQTRSRAPLLWSIFPRTLPATTTSWTLSIDSNCTRAGSPSWLVARRTDTEEGQMRWPMRSGVGKWGCGRLLKTSVHPLCASSTNIHRHPCLHSRTQLLFAFFISCS